MRTLKRRKFISNSLKGTAAIALTHTALSSQQVRGANERINIALLGCGGRGRYVARGMIEQGAALTHLCDLHDGRMDQTENFLSEVQKRKPKRVKDMRALFEIKEIDAVIVATPDHWHAPASILAINAGKDVYVEKPPAHNIWESQKMIEAVKSSKQFIQVGTQNRSAPYTLAGLEYVNKGDLGRIGLVKVYNLKSGGPFKLSLPGTQPKDFNWDAWLGPASQRPYYEQIFEGGWHKFWDYSGGDLADDAIHQLDLALMLLGDPGLPSSVSCMGGRLVYSDDDAEVPDVQVATFAFKDFILTLELTNYPRYMEKTTTTIRRNDLLPYWTQNATRIELYGSELMMVIGRHGGGWQVMTSGGKVIEQMYGRPADEPHYKNFLDCVKERKQPTASIDIAHNACTMIHMANIAHRIGNVSLKYDTAKENFYDNSEANKLIKRVYRKEYENWR